MMYITASVLSLISLYFVLKVQGGHSCSQNTLNEHELTISSNVESCSESMDYVVMEATQSLAAVTYPSAKSISGLLTKIVKLHNFH